MSKGGSKNHLEDPEYVGLQVCCSSVKPHLPLLSCLYRSEQRSGRGRDGSVPGNDAAAAGELHAHRAGETAGHHHRHRERGTLTHSLCLSLPASVSLRPSGCDLEGGWVTHEHWENTKVTHTVAPCQ